MTIKLVVVISLILSAARAHGQNPIFEKIIGEKTIGEYAAECSQLSSGSIFLMGHADIDSVGQNDFSLTKLDSAGSLIWHKYYGTTDADYCNFGFKTSDHCFVFGGQSYGATGSGLIVKVDTLGNLIWQHSIQSPSYQSGYHRACEGSDSTYYVCGFQTDTSGGAGNNIYVEKLDYSGNTVWAKNFGSNLNDYAQSIEFTSDSNLILVSDRIAANFYYDIVISKLDTTGNVLWDVYQYKSTYNSGSQSIHELNDGSYLAIGESGLISLGTFDISLTKVSPSGNVLLDTLVSGTNESEAGFDFVEDTLNGDLYLVGYGWDTTLSEHQLLFWQTDSIGNVKAKSFYGTNNAPDIAYDIEPSVYGGYIFCGETNVASKQYYVIYDSVPGPLLSIPSEMETYGVELYPNPASSASIIHYPEITEDFNIELYSIHGKLLHRSSIKSGSSQYKLPKLPSGTVVVKFIGSGKTLNSKVLIQSAD